MRFKVTSQLGFSDSGVSSGGRWESIIIHAKRAEDRSKECIAVSDRCTSFKGEQFEIRLTMSILFFFDELIEACKVVL